MAPEAAASIPEDLEQLRRRFEEYRNTQSGRSRLPKELWEAAAELAQHYGTLGTKALVEGAFCLVAQWQRAGALVGSLSGAVTRSRRQS
jgi:hypothetical protein